MAPLLTQILQKSQWLRFLLVMVGVVGVMGVLNNWKDSEALRMARLEEVTAGSSPSLVLQGEAESDVLLTLVQPNQLEETLDVELGSDGKGSVVLPGEWLESAGTYSVAASYAHGDEQTVQQEFLVKAGAPSLSKSRVSFSSGLLNPTQTVTMSVVLQDEFGNPLVGHALSVSADQAGVSVYSSEFVSNEQGQMNFFVTGSGTGLVRFSLFDSTLGQSILGQPQLALTGGNSASEPSIQLAESGAVSAFVISGLDEKTLVGENQSITVKAVDADGFVVTDYTGTVHFSSTDDEASLPDDYSFLAADQGEHTFSLSVKFVTPGAQSVTATDADHTSLDGTADTTVVTSTDSEVSYGSDFETSDFEREGDFDLVSPASGSYSTNTIEVQGAAEYGYTAVIYVNNEEAGRSDVDFDNSFTYSLEDLEDGTYQIYAEIVDADKEDALIESSSSEKVVVDTVAPEIVSIASDPEDNLHPGDTVTVTVLSEAKLDDASLIFEDEVFPMEETSTSGKYQADLVLPNAAGTYSMDVLLSDTLGNETQYRDQLTLEVTDADDTTDPSTPEEEEPDSTDTSSEPGKVSGLIATGGEEKVALTWDAADVGSSALAFYRVYYGPTPDSMYALSETKDSSTNWTISDLTAGELYYFSVAAVDIEGTEGEHSSAILGVPEAAPSSTPSLPSYPVSTDLNQHVTQNPQTGPNSFLLVLISSLGAMGYVGFRKRARA